jgi:predicted transcriptional regulator
MSKASILAHKEIKPKKPSMEQQIHSYLETKGATTLEMLGFQLGIKAQTASARLSEMHDKGIVTFDPYGAYRLTYNDAEKLEVIKQRCVERFVKWSRQGEKNGWIATAQLKADIKRLLAMADSGSLYAEGKREAYESVLFLIDQK